MKTLRIVDNYVIVKSQLLFDNCNYKYSFDYYNCMDRKFIRYGYNYVGEL